jgi:hypothetical protein
LTERLFWDEFHELIRKIMEAQGYEVARNPLVHTPKGRLREIDIMTRSSDGGVLPVEVKLDVSASITLSRLRDASSAAGSLKAFTVKTMPLLVLVLISSKVAASGPSTSSRLRFGIATSFCRMQVSCGQS